MIDVSVKVGEKEFEFKFARLWQFKLFFYSLNWYVKFLHKWYGVPLDLECEEE